MEQQPDQKPTPRKPLDRDPRPPRPDVIAAVEGRLLDPATAITVKGVTPRPTVYVGPRLVVSKAVDFEGALRVLRAVAEPLGWDVVPEPEDPRTAGLRFGVRAVRIVVASNRATIAPDGWTLLQQTRAQLGIESVVGVGLDHVVFADPHNEGHPLVGGNPHNEGHPVDSPLSTYAIPGSGGRQPVSYVGPPPRRRSTDEIEGRRPVVAILDTGCGSHPWLDDVVDTEVGLDGVAIGLDDPGTAPDVLGDLVGPLDGVIDTMSGHGTFIAGLVHQACPDADILAWRIMPSEGPIPESTWITALAQVAELVRRHRAGEPGGRAIDVLSMSIGYYHETPEDLLFDPTLFLILADLAAHGTVVVCSAGNDATSRPTFPAAFAPWAGGGGPVPDDPGRLPIVSVGALNPNRRSDALFTNAGPWVRAHETGAAVLSTMPPFQGGLQAIARTTAFGRTRESIDPDDFRGGFAVWSGTSFSAPLLAGRLAAQLCGSLVAEDAASAVDRGWSAVEALTSIRR